MSKQRESILAERETTHGSFAANAELWSRMVDLLTEYSEGDHSDIISLATTMICLKLSRATTGNATEPDHWRDIAGYANLVLESLERTDA